MMALLVDGPATAQDIAEETGMSAQSVRDYLRAMRKRHAVFVARWDLDQAGRQTLAAYQLGRRPDAVRVPPRSRAEIARQYRARQRDVRLLRLAA